MEVSRTILLMAYILSALPLAYLSFKLSGYWSWIARVFVAEKTLLIISATGVGTTSLGREIVSVGFFIAFVIEFVILLGVAIRTHYSKMVVVPRETKIEVISENGGHKVEVTEEP
jgi:hypothetical protein